MTPAVWFLSYEQFQRVRPGPSAVAISISDRFYEAVFAPGYASVLKLRFADADPAREPVSPAVQCFTAAHAGELLAWCDLWLARQDIAHVFVHCWAGRSRSAAIAWWISHHYGLRLQTRFTPRHANRHVLRLLPGDYLPAAWSTAAEHAPAARLLDEDFAPLPWRCPAWRVPPGGP